jgi:hypothetical protein
MPGLLSRLRENLRKGAATTEIRSKEMIDAQRIRRRIARLGKERSRHMQDLGQAVYEMSGKGKLDEEAINVKCAGIADLDSQIKEHQVQVEELHQKAQEALEKTKAE